MKYVIDRENKESIINLSEEEVLEIIPSLFFDMPISFNIYNEHGKQVTSEFYQNNQGDWIHNKE